MANIAQRAAEAVSFMFSGGEARPARAGGPVEKLTIGSLDDQKLTLVAQYNPKELQLTQTAQWTQHPKMGQEPEDALHLEYGTARQPRTMSIELLFDGVERGGVMEGTSMTVLQAIGTLEAMITVRSAPAGPYEDVRPHCCVVVWGKEGVPPMTCVLEQLQTKYQVLDASGRVLRATCTVNIKEASRVDKSLKARRYTADRWSTEQRRAETRKSGR